MNKIIYTLLLGICFTACTNEEPAGLETLFGLPGDTPVRVIAEIEEKAPSRTEGETENTYAAGEIHKGSASVSISLTNPDKEVTNGVTFEGINDALGLTANDFASFQGWSVLRVKTEQDILVGWSQPEDNTNPVLFFNLKHARAKLTLKIQDNDGNNVELSNGVTAKVKAYLTEPEITSTEGTEPTFTLKKVENAPLQDFTLTTPVDAGGQNTSVTTELTALIPATTNDDLTDDEVLEITKDSDTYTVKLNEITIDNGTHPFAPGNHIILTVKLRNVSASVNATLGEWTTESYSAAVGDESKVPDTQNP